MQPVAYIFGWLLAALATAITIPLLLATAWEEYQSAQSFLATGLFTGFVGGGLILSFKSEDRLLNRKSTLLLAALLWVVLPLPATLPFFFSPQPQGIIPAYFEAVSALTTTGATVTTDLTEMPRSILFYRSFLQWIGGLATLLFFGLILGPLTGPERIDPRLHRLNLGNLGSGRHLSEAMYTVVPIYTSMTLICFLLLLVARIPTFDAICLAFSTLSTGGFMPRAGTISLYGSPFAELILAVFMFLGAISIFWIRGLVELQHSSLRRTKEPTYIGFGILFFGAILTTLLLAQSPDQDIGAIFHTLILGIATSASLISTTGFAISPQTAQIIPYILLLTICVIGGGAFSTAGGLKAFRLVAMLKMINRDFQKLIYPHGILPTDKDRVDLSDNTALVLAANVAVVVMATAALALLLSITDLPFQAALLAAVSTIGNIGPAFEQAGFENLATDLSYADLSPAAQIALCIGMILGRVEVLALIALLNLAYWRS